MSTETTSCEENPLLEGLDEDHMIEDGCDEVPYEDFDL